MSTSQVLISCGEASGDLYASELVKELLKRRPELSAFGLGGARSEAAGMECVVRLEEVSVIGLVEVVSKLPALSSAMKRLCDAAETRGPALAVLIDFSGFNLRLARRLRSLGVRVVYYVSPQVWAWRKGRVRTIRELVEEMLVILPFEKAFYEREGVNVRYVGHPLVDLVRAKADRETFCRTTEIDPNRPFVLILPGSRRSEIDRHVPILRNAVSELSGRNPELQFVMSRAATVPPGFVEQRLGKASERVRLLEGPIYDALAHASVAIVASGTATVEAALSQTPMVVVYRAGWMSYCLGKPFVNVPFFSMVNLIAEREVVPELIQGEMTASKISEHVARLLDEDNASAQRRALADVIEKLGGPGASSRAADAVISHFELS